MPENHDEVRILMTVDRSQNHWPEKSAAVVSNENSLHFVFKELLRQHSWQATIAAADPQALIKLRHENKIGSFIIVDAPGQPATEIFRVLFKDPRCRLTPAMVVSTNITTTDSIIYEKIFQVTTCPKPVTPATFHTAFNRMISQWNDPLMIVMRRLADVPDEAAADKKIEILDRLLANPMAMPIAICALTQLLAAKGFYREAEQKLLEQCRIHSKNPAMLAFCAWFYLAANMPAQASKLLAKLKTISPTSVLLNPDIASAHLALGEVTHAFNAMHEWKRRNPGNPTVEEHLATLLIADGRTDQADHFGIPKSIMQKTRQRWESAEVQPSNNESSTRNGQKAS